MIEKQKTISDLLRTADKEIKSAKFDEAMRYINRIFELDIKNVYAKAYKERVISLMEAQGFSREEAERKANEAKPAELVQQHVPLPLPKEEKPIVQQTQQYPPSQLAQPPSAERATSAQPVATSKPQQATVAPRSMPHQTIKRTAAALEAYRTLLMEIWKDGFISDEEQGRIDSMRETFAITPEEHLDIETTVRISCYMNAIRDAWRKGITNFEPLRKQFHITEQEQRILEPKILQLIQSLQAKGSVLVLDDDEAFLEVIKSMLNDAGYYCFTAVSGEEALNLLDTMTPDIVLCDVNFTKPHMSGFAFYERFRSIDKFLATPFIFLSALDQDVLIRTGKKLGADDYLTKPIDAEMLLATVEGKLRRSRELRRSLE